MARALALARRGRGYVEPNPMVGCVLVRGEQIVGEGYHRRYGGPHAEVEAIRAAGGAARGATAYVTLEPCNHFGKTPPCTDALLAAGVRRVIAAHRDPNRTVKGGGLARLARAGLNTEVGLLQAQAAALLGPYLKGLRCGLPWVTLKWAQSVDGQLATRGGDARWITDEIMRTHANRARGFFDVVLVGIGTVLADDPLLTCRAPRPPRRPMRVVLDTRLRTPLTSRIVQTARETPTWIFAGAAAPAARRKRLIDAGCQVSITPMGVGGLELSQVLAALGEARATNVMVEGGGRMLGAFVDAGLADAAEIYIAPLLIGGRDALGALHGRGPERLLDATSLEGPSMRALGGGWLLSARLRAMRSKPVASKRETRQPVRS